MIPDYGRDLIGLALREDLGPGDVTTQLFCGHAGCITAEINARNPCILAGGRVAMEVFRRVDPSLEITFLAEDGTALQGGQTGLRLNGPAASILGGERTALNFLQHLSGVATLTRRYVEAIAGTKACILDTRKTLPGFRALEKAAVAAGGGKNHRMGLYDMVMVKDNHLSAAGGIRGLQPAIDAAKKRGLRVEIEVDTLEQLEDVLKLQGVDFVLLDNMSPETLRKAVSRRRPGIYFEASGGITLETIREVAETGVDFISVGTLTHSAPAADLGMDFPG